MKFEMNNARKDTIVNAEIRKNSPVVEVFSALVQGKTISSIAAADKAVDYIKSLGERANNGDNAAVVELNQIRRFVIEPIVLEEARVLDVFGGYQAVGIDERIEREAYETVGGGARQQAQNGDVPFAQIQRVVYPVETVTISAGFAADYRRLALGDMEKENYGLAQVRTEIMNGAAAYVMKKIYNVIKNATGVKFFAESAGITRTALDNVIGKVRRFGPANILGAYPVISQINAFANWTNSNFNGISDAAMEEIRQNGLLDRYNGAIVREVPAYYDNHLLNDAGDDFKPILPLGLLFILPQGKNAPVMTWTRGGLTTFTGNDVTTGNVLTRFDLEVAADVALGQEYKIGLLNDTNL